MSVLNHDGPGVGLFGKKWYGGPLGKMRFAMNDDFYKPRAREVRDIAAKADPFIKQRLLDLADRYDGKRKTSVTPFTAGGSHYPEPSGRTRQQFRPGPAQSCAAISSRGKTFGNSLVFVFATGTD
jgi:hypothetical protein